METFSLKLHQQRQTKLKPVLAMIVYLVKSAVCFKLINYVYLSLFDMHRLPF